MAAKGGDWKYQLTYYDADSRITREFSRSELHQVKDLLENSPLITVRLVKDPVLSFQLTTLLMYHLNVIMRTKDEKWWFSLEKVGKGLVLQRSTSLEKIQYYCEGSKRQWFNVRVTVTSIDVTTKHLFDVINWVEKQNSLDDKYNFLIENCKHFAKKAYDEIAETDIATFLDGMELNSSAQRQSQYIYKQSNV